MLTRCPACAAWFRVRAEHLSAAAGHVTCGACDTVFNALATLVEEVAPSAPATETRQASASPAAADAYAASSAPAADPGEDISRSLQTDAAAVTEAQIPPHETREQVIDWAHFALPAQDHIQPPGAVTDSPAQGGDATGAGWSPVEPTPAAVHEAVLDGSDDAAAHEPRGDEPAARDEERSVLAAADRRFEPDAEPVPELLRKEISALERERQRTPRRGLLWGLGCTALALVFVAQLFYVYRAHVIAHWPAAAPLVSRICAELGCPATTETVASPVELLARDVREHPQYHDALLVNATLVNAGASATPFPMLELVLHDASGRIIGARRFAPEEYLDHSIAIAAGMPPAQPVYIVIELGGSAAAATSFEFSFL